MWMSEEEAIDMDTPAYPIIIYFPLGCDTECPNYQQVLLLSDDPGRHAEAYNQMTGWLWSFGGGGNDTPTKENLWSNCTAAPDSLHPWTFPKEVSNVTSCSLNNTEDLKVDPVIDAHIYVAATNKRQQLALMSLGVAVVCAYHNAVHAGKHAENFLKTFQAPLTQCTVASYEDAWVQDFLSSGVWPGCHRTAQPVTPMRTRPKAWPKQDPAKAPAVPGRSPPSRPGPLSGLI